MNKGILLAASAVMALGFVSCEETDGNESASANPTLEINSENLTILERKIEDSQALEVFQLSVLGLLFAYESNSSSEACDGGGSTNQTLVVDEEAGTTDLTVELQQCTSPEGMVVNGKLDYSVNSDDTTPLTGVGYLEITGLPEVTSLRYDDLSMTYLDDDSEIETNITITSDDISGTVNYKMVTNGDVTTTTVTGANNTSFVYVNNETDYPAIETCTLNGAAVSCE